MYAMIHVFVLVSADSGCMPFEHSQGTYKCHFQMPVIEVLFHPQEFKK